MDTDKIEKLVDTVDELLETLKLDLKRVSKDEIDERSTREPNSNSNWDRESKPVYDSRAGA